MKLRVPQTGPSTAAICRQIIKQLTRAGFAMTLAPRLPAALATVQHTPGVLVIVDQMDPQAGQHLVEDLHETAISKVCSSTTSVSGSGSAGSRYRSISGQPRSYTRTIPSTPGMR